MASPRHPTKSMENLPGDVLSNIFMRLLSKQLAQMRCVCKPLNAFLSKSSFVKSHLHRSIHHNEKILLFFGGGFSFDVCPFTSRPTRSPHRELTNFIKIPDNPQSKDGRGGGIGSVNGLICYYYKSSFDDFAIYIWNPSLSAVLTLPPCSLPSKSQKIQFGFGYDPKTDDYKVVKIRNYKKCEVYSMRKGTWELISERFPLHIWWLSTDQNQICTDGHNGHVHWLCATDLKEKPETIVAFDLGDETFSEMPLPDSILHLHGHCFNVLGVLSGKLCVMSSVEGGGFEVWVMDEYGVAESWVKNLVFSGLSGDIAQYGFTSDNELLFEVDEDGCFALYDPIGDKTKDFKIVLGKSDTRKVVEYVDSLVWIAPTSKLQI